MAGRLRLDEGHGTELQGDEQDVIDYRVSYSPEVTNWQSKCRLDDNGDVVVPYDVVEQLFVENEMLRETLYINQNSAYSRAVTQIGQLTGHSTSHVIKAADRIENLSGGILSAKEVYGFLYRIMESNYRVTFKYRKSRESKLQYLWRTGNLPIMSMLIHIFEMFLRNLKAAAPKEFNELVKEITHKVKKNSNKSKKVSTKALTF